MTFALSPIRRIVLALAMCMLLLPTFPVWADHPQTCGTDPSCWHHWHQDHTADEAELYLSVPSQFNWYQWHYGHNADGTTPVPHTPEPRPAVTVQVTAALVNLRDGPGTQHKILGQIRHGASLAVLGLSENREWLRLAPVAQNRWIYAALTDIPPAVRAELIVWDPTAAAPAFAPNVIALRSGSVVWEFIDNSTQWDWTIDSCQDALYGIFEGMLESTVVKSMVYTLSDTTSTHGLPLIRSDEHSFLYQDINKSYRQDTNGDDRIDIMHHAYIVSHFTSDGSYSVEMSADTWFDWRRALHTPFSYRRGVSWSPLRWHVDVSYLSPATAPRSCVEVYRAQ